jgi:hypothetical protein
MKAEVGSRGLSRRFTQTIFQRLAPFCLLLYVTYFFGSMLYYKIGDKSIFESQLSDFIASEPEPVQGIRSDKTLDNLVLRFIPIGMPKSDALAKLEREGFSIREVSNQGEELGVRYETYIASFHRVEPSSYWIVDAMRYHPPYQQYVSIEIHMLNDNVSTIRTTYGRNHSIWP